jgi:hypothetical protein
MEIDTEHLNTSVSADEPVDDLARDDPVLSIVAQAGLHLMADDGPDLKDFALRCAAWNEHAWGWSGHC